jgi:tetratricopeptide (TPR) repeat protein
MKLQLALCLALIGVSLSVEAGQRPRPPAATPPPAPDRVAQAYNEYLLAQRLEDEDDVEGAIAAYKRAMTLEPEAASIVGELASMYMRQNRLTDAIATAEQALKASPDNQQAHRVLGTVYATLATSPRERSPRQAQQEYTGRAITHLEAAVAGPGGRRDANLRAILARLYVTGAAYDKAIPALLELIKEEPGWEEGPLLLVEAYTASGQTAEAVRWLEASAADQPRLYSTLGDLYAQERRWQEAAGAYEKALADGPRNSFDLRVRYASMLLNAGGQEAVLKARDALREALMSRGTDERALYLSAQAERRAGDLDASEAVARRLIAQNARNPRGYSLLAEVLEQRRRYQGVVDALAPAVPLFRGGGNSAAGLGQLLPHLGFAYQQLGKFDQAIAAFEEARKITPGNSVLTAYLIQANIAAKNYSAAIDLARAARAAHPDDLQLARLEAHALGQSNRADQGIALLEGVLQRNADNPDAHISLAEMYAESNRGAQAVKLLQEAQVKFPGENAIDFELAAVLEKQKRYSEAEAVFRQLLTRDPEHAPTLNYLGYMLAERGVRLEESIELITRALKSQPDNGSYLDSLGWAYYKDGKFDLAEVHLRRAAEQLTRNSVVQDHFGDVLARLQRYEEAIAAWNRALEGDGDSIDREDIDKKIRSVRQKLPKR